MAISVKVGHFDTSTSAVATDTLAVTGVGFQPKIVLLFWSGHDGASSGAVGQDMSAGWGAFTTASNRMCVNYGVDDGVATSASVRSQHNARCVKVHLNGTTTETGGLDVSSMDSDGFTLVYDVAFTFAIRVSYIALGGADLTNYHIATKAVPIVTGNYSVTGLGFQPDAMLTFCSSVNAATNHTSDAIWMMGMTDGTTQGVVQFNDDSGQATMQTDGYAYVGELIAASSTANTINIRESLVSLDSDGFTMNHLEGTASAYVYHYIALKGGNYKVGTVDTSTSTGNVAETGVGFQPKGLITMSANRALSTQDTMSAHAQVTYGATDGTDQYAHGTWSENGLADSEATVGYSNGHIYYRVENDAVSASAALSSFDSDGFTINVDDAEPTAASAVIYLAIGDEPAGGVTTLTAAEGSFTESGQSAAFQVSMAAGHGSYS